MPDVTPPPPTCACAALLCHDALDTRSAVPAVRRPCTRILAKRAQGRPEVEPVPIPCRCGTSIPIPWRAAPLAFHKEGCSSHQVQVEPLLLFHGHVF